MEFCKFDTRAMAWVWSLRNVSICLLLAACICATAQAGCPGGVCEMPALAVRKAAAVSRGVVRKAASLPVRLVRRLLG